MYYNNDEWLRYERVIKLRGGDKMTEEESVKRERYRLIGMLKQCDSEVDEITNSNDSNAFKIMRLKQLRKRVIDLRESYLEISNFIQLNYDSRVNSRVV